MASRGNGHNDRGRGRGRGRPQRYRGFPTRGQSTNNGRGRGRGRPVYNDLNIIDVDIQRYADDSPGSGTVTPNSQYRGWRGGHWRARGRGQKMPLNLQVYTNGHRTPPPPRREDGSGTATPTRRDRERGPSRGLGAGYNPNMPLSKLLALDRPYLRPVNFVRAELTPVLFEHEDEIIEVHEFHEPEGHVPTAEQVSRVFGHQPPPPPQDSFFQDADVDLFADASSERVMTVDFRSLGDLIEDTPISLPKTEAESETLPNQILADAVPGMSIFDSIKEALHINDPQTTAVAGFDNIHILQGSESRNHDGQTEEGEPITASQETTVQFEKIDEIQETSQEDEKPVFILDAQPARAAEKAPKITYTPASSGSQPLGKEQFDDDEVIVYVAPHPRSGRATPTIPNAGPVLEAAKQPIVSFSADSLTQGVLNIPSTSRTAFTKELETTSAASSSSTTQLGAQPVSMMSFTFDRISEVAEINRQQTASPRARRLTKRDRQVRGAKRKGKYRGSFGKYGAMLEELHLHEDDETRLVGKRGTREGSDIDWGDEETASDRSARAVQEAQDIEKISSSLGDMVIDGDLDIGAMRSFARSMSNRGMEHTRIDDIEDEEKLRLEDEEEGVSSSGSENVDSEADAIVQTEEAQLIGEAVDKQHLESESDVDVEDVSSDEDETPKRSFQARLMHVRESAKAKKKMNESAFSAAQADAGGLFGERISKLQHRDKPQSDEDEDDFDANFTWAERDENYLADIQDLLDEDDVIFSDRKQRKLFFKQIRDGDFSVSPAKKKRDYSKDLPPQLLGQWERDRAKKAVNKQKRAAARLEVAADPFAMHKGGKKGRKDMLRASRLAGEARTDSPGPADPDLGLVVRQIRQFINNIDLNAPMALPPMDKLARKKVHEIATAFGLKSQSKGKGEARYTTLIKTTRTGMRIDERRVERMVHSAYGGSGRGKGSGSGNGPPKHKEGEEVGKAAPKIGEANIGFQMLANMGWADGQSIGVSGGLDAPLTAIIKHSKLGLGATR